MCYFFIRSDEATEKFRPVNMSHSSYENQTILCTFHTCESLINKDVLIAGRSLMFSYVICSFKNNISWSPVLVIICYHVFFICVLNAL